MPHARGGLVPILSWTAKSIRKGGRIKQKQGAHDAVSSDLVSLSLPQNEWPSSRKMSGERSGYWIIPRDQIRNIKYTWLPFSAYQCLNALRDALENILKNFGSKYQITFA